jgi:hypothetical protein
VTVRAIRHYHQRGLLTQHRRKIAVLGGGERLFLPPEIVDILDELRRIGVSERTVQIERDGWILVVALSPEVIPEWVSVKRAAVALMASRIVGSSPTWEGLNELSQKRMESLRDPAGSA